MLDVAHAKNRVWTVVKIFETSLFTSLLQIQVFTAEGKKTKHCTNEMWQVVEHNNNTWHLTQPVVYSAHNYNNLAYISLLNCPF